jgi:hypothetical protein
MYIKSEIYFFFNEVLLNQTNLLKKVEFQFFMDKKTLFEMNYHHSIPKNVNFQRI